METEEQLYEEIEGYLANTLSREAYLQFKERLAKNPDLAAQVELHRSVRDAISDHGEIEFEDTIRELGLEHEASDSDEEDQEEEKKKTPSFNYRRRIFFVAASIVLLCLIGWLAFSPFGSPATPPELFAQNFEAYTAPSNFRGDVPKDKLDSAFIPYRKGDYPNTLLRLEALGKVYQNNEQILFFSGICELAAGDVSLAQNYLEQVLALPDNQSKVQTQWYLALSWLKADQKEKARPLLLELKGFPNKYQSRSEEILQQIDG